VSAIAAGRFHVLALKEGRVIAWGGSFPGDTSVTGALAVPPEAQRGVRAIAAGDQRSFALKNGAALEWSTYSPLGVPTSDVVRIAAGGPTLVAIAANSTRSGSLETESARQ
jgi:hypothetical protein